MAWWPMPSRPWPSVIQMLSSLSMQIPCGKMNMPEPKLFRSFPLASNSSTGSSVEPAQLFLPHRSATQMWPFGIDIDGAGGSHGAALGQMEPAGDGLVRIRKIVHGLIGGEGGGRGGDQNEDQWTWHHLCSCSGTLSPFTFHRPGSCAGGMFKRLAW